MRKTKRRVPVSTRAILQRINRRLRAEGAVLKGTRGRGGGAYRLVTGSFCTDPDVNVPRLAKRLGVIAPWEELRP